MLQLQKIDNTIIIYFDLPISMDIQNHKEFKRLSEMIQLTPNCHFEFGKNQEILKCILHYNSFMELIDKVLPSNQATKQKEIIDYFYKQHSNDKKGLEVNFHQKPYDNADRYWNFILNQNFFIEHFFNRINWFIAPKREYVTNFPLHVDIESASTCNMNCPMCYRNQLKHTGQMDFNLFKKAVDECADNNVFSIRLSWRGETLTHPMIKEMISYATRKIKNVSFLTNAFYIDENMCDCFIENQVSYIAVSFDGIKEVYDSIRHPAKFIYSYKYLETLKNKKTKAGSTLPQVRLCTIWPAIKENPDEYYNTMKKVSDYIVCNPYINFKGKVRLKKDFICQYPWERIVIGYDGTTQCCTGWNADDIHLGNLKEDSIYEMWHSDLMKKVRSIHASGRRMEINSCANCRHGSETDPNISIWEIVDRKF